MRQILMLLALIVLAAFASSCLAGQPADKLTLSEKEKAAITAAVKKETEERIFSIERESRHTVKVLTGKVTPGRLEGGGKIFTFKRTKQGWEFQKQLIGQWVS